MRAVVVRSLVVIAVGAALLAGVLYIASTVDARPPQVLSIAVTQPIAGDEDAALITTSIEVTFSEPIEVQSAAEVVRLEPRVEGSASMSGSTLIFTPGQPLDLETEYTVTVSGDVRDLAGNEISEAPPPYTFETAGRPTVVETEPEHGAEEVAVDAPIAVRFSTLMDTASVEAGLRLRPTFAHELRWNGELLEIVPAEPLQADRPYTVSIAASAADVAGVEIGTAVSVEFRTVAPGLRVEALVPADGIDGIAPGTSIAVIFDRPIDPASIDDDLLVTTPSIAGTLDVVPDDPESDGFGRVLRFTPSGALPPNTTFDVELGPGVTSESGGGLAEPLAWSFTTGAPSATVSNQITFLTARGGVTNVWAMNSDGTGQHQLSVELEPVVDYAVAPDGSSLVVADGRRLVFLRADGSERRVLTDDAHLEFDPTYAPNGQVIAFGRADAATGAGLGLWRWEVGGGAPERLEMPADLRSSPQPSADGQADGQADALLRAPRYAPDGLALAFIDAAGAVGILELPAQRLTMVPFAGSAPPAWLPDSRAVLLTGAAQGEDPTTGVEAPVLPLEPDADDAVYRLSRSGTTATETALGAGWRVLGIAGDGTIAWADPDGALGTTTSLDDAGEPLLDDREVAAAAFAPGEAAMVIVAGDRGQLELLDLDSGERSTLAPQGARPRWVP